MRNFILKLLKAVDKSEYEKVLKQLESSKEICQEISINNTILSKELVSSKAKINELNKEIDNLKETLNKTDNEKIKALQAQVEELESIAANVVYIFFKLNDGDVVKINGKVFNGTKKPCIKDDEYTVAIYDKDGNLYPKLIIDSMTEIRDFKGDKYNG